MVHAFPAGSAASNWRGYDVLLSLIAVLLMLSPLVGSTNEVGAPLGTKMLGECIDGADVEPPKAICNFIHVTMRLQTAMVETYCKRRGVGISSRSVPSPKKKT